MNMGYDYYVLITAINDSGEIIELYYNTKNESCDTVNEHYLYNKACTSNMINYNGKRNMGEYCYKIPFYDIVCDYRSSMELIDSDVTKIVNSNSNKYDKFKELRKYILNLEENFVEYSNNVLKELEYYYELCIGYSNEGYYDINLFYGISH